VGSGHAECYRSDKFASFFETFTPSAKQASHLVDVEIESQRMLIDVHLRKGRLPDTGRTVDVNESRHARSLRFYKSAELSEEVRTVDD